MADGQQAPIKAGHSVGRPMPRIMRVTEADASVWPAALDRAASLGFDTVLLPEGEVPPSLIRAAGTHGIALLSDIVLDRAPSVWLATTPGPFTTTIEPMIDPRAAPAMASVAMAAIGTVEDAKALAGFWAARMSARQAQGVSGFRLLGLDRLPGWAVPAVLTGLREACPECVLFGWTPGLTWPVLTSIPAHALDLVAASLPWWDGRADWLWQELETLRSIAPVVADAGDDPARQAFAAALAEGWMTTAAGPGVPALNEMRLALSGLPWSRLASAGGGPGYALLRTDTPDPRRASRAVLAFTALTDCEIDPAEPLAAVGGDFLAFEASNGTRLEAGSVLALAAGALHVFASSAHHPVIPASLSRTSALAAAAGGRVAIEALSPCVEGGRFPARQVVGSEVVVEADLIADGHDKLGAVLRFRTPRSEAWEEVRMRPAANDRWTARFPLRRLGVHEYVIEAWKDSYASFVDELEKKYAAGVPITLEMQEGGVLVKAAALRAEGALKAALSKVLGVLDAEGPDVRRMMLLADETRAAMALADDRPFRTTTPAIPVQAERTAAGFASWYEVFPRSLSDDPARHGTFRDVVHHLPRVQAMGFDVLYFPPFHPIGRVNRKGANNTLTPAVDDPGSPYAIGSIEGGHEALHPELGSIEDFQHLRQEAAARGIELAMDFAIQCAPDHPWLKTHKDWFDWRPDGTIKYAENPPKKYQDIVNVDFYAKGAIPDLWLALANAVLYWAGQGIRLFRVDNPHTKPLPFWEWMISEVQARYPDAVFLAEAFTRPKVMYQLAKSGFGQSYTYFTWRNSKREFQEYMTELTDPRPGSPREFFRPHFFVNTPDINPVPLQDAPRQAFLIRVALASTLSGLWGLYNGFELCEATPVPGREEYLDSEKYQLRAWDWDRPGNIVAEISALNAIRKRNPALHTHLGVSFLAADNDQVLLFEKATPDRSNVVLVAINMDPRNPQSSRIEVPFWRWSIGHPEEEPQSLLATDLLTDRQERWTDRSRIVSFTAAKPYALWRLRLEQTA